MMTEPYNNHNQQSCESISTLPEVGSVVWITQPRTKTPYVASILKHYYDSNRNYVTEIQWSICGRKELINLKECQIELITSRRRGRKKLKLSPKQREHQRQKRQKTLTKKKLFKKSKIETCLEEETNHVTGDIKNIKGSSSNRSNQKRTQLFLNETKDKNILSNKNCENASQQIKIDEPLDKLLSLSNQVGKERAQSCNETPKNLSPHTKCLTNLTDPKSSQSQIESKTQDFEFCLNSAYLQHLAEMSHMILNDLRWKTGQKRLFDWQNGDDLSAMVALEKLYQHKGDDTNDVIKGVAENNNHSYANVRQLHLYARLFHRKGPWYTLDDLFFRYYHSNDAKKKRLPTEIEDVNETCDKEVKSCELPKNMPGEKKSIFELKDIGKSSLDNSTHVKDTLSKNDSYFFSSLESLEKVLFEFFWDIQDLCSRGLFRSFSSEQECGIVSGNVDPNGRNGTFLTNSERDTVLQKLGGSSPKKKNKGEIMKENAIWKQMRTQRSIFSTKASLDTKTQLLPVRHHVNTLFLRKFSSRILSLLVHKSSLTVNTISILIAKIWRKVFDNAVPRRPMSFPDLFMCVRLREQPLLTLRRAIRLILCASSGPGIMRNDPYSGWGLTVIEPSLEADGDNSHDLKTPSETHVKLVGNITLPQPPNTSSWGKVSYRSLHHRLGLFNCEYQEYFEPILQSPPKKISFSRKYYFQTFLERQDFLKWETSLQIRAVVDYLIEWNDVVLCMGRKKIKSQKGDNMKKENMTLSDDNPDEQKSNKGFNSLLPSVEDSLHLLCAQGRKFLIDNMMGISSPSNSQNYDSHDSVLTCEQIQKKIETEIDSLKLLDDSFQCECPSCKSRRFMSEGLMETDRKSNIIFNTDAERIICIIAIICNQILLSEYQMSKTSLPTIVHRPWLRHMYWQSVLAYIIWDCVKNVEKTGHHELAIFLLQSILIGSTHHSTFINFYKSILKLPCQMDIFGNTRSPFGTLSRIGRKYDIENLVQVLLSRRTRGKAFDRLFIDLHHVFKKQKKVIVPEGSKNLPKKKQSLSHGEICVQNIYLEIFNLVISKSSIPFSSKRSLARRLKKPFSWKLPCDEDSEIRELQLRTKNSSCDHGSIIDDDVVHLKRINHWSPIVDFSFANTIVNEDNSKVGRRCSFMGNEESDDAYGVGRIRSLTVEELAIEEYHIGKLPFEDTENLKPINGGWVGWHDEGGHVRTLFRLFLSSILISCHSEQNMNETDLWYEKYTVFLTPYQCSPHDLHVGHFGKIRSFYERRNHMIRIELKIIENMSPQEISDFFYDCITKREKLSDTSNKKLKGNWLLSDMNELRTLCMIAAGLGGKMLSRIFRALCFDYRYYSGGLPDLLLVRAISSEPSKMDDLKLIDLGSWIGEYFQQGSSGNLKAYEMARMLINREDEFLGFARESETGKKRRSQRRMPHNVGEEKSKTVNFALPSKLSLVHEDRKVTVECMFIEVKSANDRLDGRQEDWLNILDESGQARVCKIHGSTKNKGKK